MRTHIDLHRMQQELEQLVDERTLELNESRTALEEKVRKLQESQERYELAVSGSAAGIWDWDMLADKVYYSNRLIHLLGYSADEFSDTQEEFWSRLHSDDYEETRQALDRHLEEREPFVLDFRIRTKSGEYRWFHNRGQALWDKTGKATRMSGSVTDITPRKKVEEAILRSEERFRSLLEQSPMPMEILSEDGKILHSNSSWNKLWGVDAAAAAEVMEKYNMLTDPKLKRLGIDHLVEKAFSGEHIILPPIIYDAYETVENFEIEKLSGLKSPWIQCHLYPIKDKNGRS